MYTLQLGNILLYNNTNINKKIYVNSIESYSMQIGWITLDNKEHGWADEYYFYPIIITEELLLKLGFIKEKDSLCNHFEFKKWIDGYPITVNSLSNTQDKDYSVHIDSRCYDTILRADIQYLHQLQNAIYLTTNRCLYKLNANNIIE